MTTREVLDENLSYWTGSTWFLATLVPLVMNSGEVGKESVCDWAELRPDDRRFTLLRDGMDHPGKLYPGWVREVDDGEHLDFLIRISRYLAGTEIQFWFLEVLTKHPDDREIALAVIAAVSGVAGEAKLSVLRFLVSLWSEDEGVMSKLSLAFRSEEATREVFMFLGEIWALHEYSENVMAHFVHAGIRLDPELADQFWEVVWERHSGSYEFLVRLARGLVWNKSERAGKWLFRCRDSVGDRLRDFDWNLLQQIRQRTRVTEHGWKFVELCLSAHGHDREFLPYFVIFSVERRGLIGFEWLKLLYERTNRNDGVWRQAVRRLNTFNDPDMELLTHIYLWRSGSERTWIREAMSKRIASFRGVGERWLEWAERLELEG